MKMTYESDRAELCAASASEMARRIITTTQIVLEQHEMEALVGVALSAHALSLSQVFPGIRFVLVRSKLDNLPMISCEYSEYSCDFCHMTSAKEKWGPGWMRCPHCQKMALTLQEKRQHEHQG